MGSIVLDFLVKTLNGMALGLFATLIVGVIIDQFGTLLNLAFLYDLAGILKSLMGIWIGIGVAYSSRTKILSLYSILEHFMGQCTVIGKI